MTADDTVIHSTVSSKLVVSTFPNLETQSGVLQNQPNSWHSLKSPDDNVSANSLPNYASQNNELNTI